MNNTSTKQWKNVIGISIILFFLVYPFVQYLMEDNNKRLLENAIQTKGIIVEIHTPEVIHGSYYGVFNYNIDNHIYSFKEHGDFSRLNLRDTVLIIYSVANHSVARIKDKYYMTKSKHLKTNVSKL